MENDLLPGSPEQIIPIEATSQLQQRHLETMRMGMRNLHAEIMSLTASYVGLRSQYRSIVRHAKRDLNPLLVTDFSHRLREAARTSYGVRVQFEAIAKATHGLLTTFKDVQNDTVDTKESL